MAEGVFPPMVAFDQLKFLLRVLSSLFILAFYSNCQYDYFRSAIDKEKDTEAPVIQSSDPAGNATIRVLSSVKITFSEPVTGAAILSNYSLSGDGAGTLALTGIVADSDNQVTLQFSGTLVDGNITVKINGITDKVNNPLRDTDLSFTSDATPKWRYIGRGLSRRTIANNYGPGIAADSQYIYVAITETTCYTGSSGVTDVSVMKYNFSSGTWSVVGDYCLGGASLTTNSNFPSLLLHNGKLFEAHVDGATFDGTNTFARVRLFDGTQWNIFGSPLPAQVGANSRFPVLAADGDNIYLSVRDLGNGGKASVYRNSISTPGAWTLMGTNGLSAGNVFRQSPITIFNNELYIGFRDGGSVSPTGKPSVLKWDGSSSWTSTGLADAVASDYVNFQKTATELWAIYQSGTTGVSAMKYSAGTWSVGASTMTAEGTPNYLSSVMIGGYPYVAYQVNASNTCLLKRYDGTSWSQLGGTLTCGNPSITLIGSVIYAVFRDKDPAYSDLLSGAYFQ